MSGLAGLKTCRLFRGLLTLLCVAISAASLHVWEGHDWNQWQQGTTWQKPELHTDQAGRRDLAQLLGDDSTSTNRITTVSGWEERRKQIAAAIQKILGEPSNKSSSRRHRVSPVQTAIGPAGQCLPHPWRHRKHRRTEIGAVGQLFTAALDCVRSKKRSLHEAKAAVLDATTAYE